MCRPGAAHAWEIATCVIAIALLAIGCDNSEPTGGIFPGGSGGGAGTGGAGSSAGDGSASGGFATGSASATTGATSGGAAGNGSSGGTTGSAGSTTEAGLPCDVAEVLNTHCVECHASDPLFGAPMPLTSWNALTALHDGAKVYDRVLSRVNDDARPMPPAPHARLTSDEVAVLSGWVAQGAPAAASGTMCSGSNSGGSSGQGSGGTTAGTGGLPPPADCQDFYELTAHGGSTATDPSPHPVSARPPKNNNEYHCFFFQPPYAPGSEGLWFEPIIDNSRVLHHWLLYGTDLLLEPDGSSVPCDATEEGAYLLAGWAPGASTRVMPEDVAMQLPTSPGGLILEVHYYNNGGQAAQDRSGVRFCTAPKGTRPNLAGVHFTGTEGICLEPGQRKDVTGVCDPPDTQDIHIIDIWPHMHELGVNMKLTLNRANGSREVIHDAPFDFNSQIGYPVDVVMHPGDTLTTTCSYLNSTQARVPFGETTQEEMCYGFVTAWPVGALEMVQNAGSPVQPARRCMDGLSVMGSCNGVCDAPGLGELLCPFQ